MLLYILPFVLLLVVAVILKKRESSKTDEQPKKITKKPATNKTVKKVTKPVAEQPKQDVVTESKKIEPALRRQIENLIQQQNFSAAEALINQALNENNQQHDLYFLLLDIHQQQNDEFAIKQLLNHLGALKLDDIKNKLEQKIKEKERKTSNDGIQYTPIQLDEHKDDETKTTTSKSSDNNAFEQLKKNNDEAFDSILEESKTEQNFNALDFGTEQKSTSTPEPKVEQPKEEKKTDNTHELDFSFSPEPTTEQSIEEKKADDTHELDFNFSPEPKSEQPKENKKADDAHELDFSFSPEPTAEQRKEEKKADDAHELDFSLSTDSEVEKDSDPLLNEFPELKHLNEHELDLDLAEQYIKLGANESAKVLLTQTSFNEQQQTRAKNLLNKIAS